MSKYKFDDSDKYRIFRNVCYFISREYREEFISERLVEDFINGRAIADEVLFGADLVTAIFKTFNEVSKPKPDSMDIWRENLKAWALRPQLVSSIQELREEQNKVGCLSVACQEIEDFQLFQVHAHYKGEF